MTKQKINKYLNVILDCINDIRLDWQVEMNIQVLKLTADELLKKFKEDEK
jgi:hypothetical protein